MEDILIKPNQIKTIFNITLRRPRFKKDLNRRKFADKVLRNKAFNIAKAPKYDEYQRCLVSMVYKVLDKKTSGSGIKNENISNK